MRPPRSPVAPATRTVVVMAATLRVRGRGGHRCAGSGRADAGPLAAGPLAAGPWPYPAEVDTTLPSGTTKRRIELRLARPLLTWFARPTVTIDGVGHPAQWGTGTWAVADDGRTVIGVYLFNRAWRFGGATLSVGNAAVLEYHAGPFPLGAGRLTPGRDSR